MKTERNGAHDMMKGIGILAMMFCHLTDGIAHPFIHSFHMPLFFLLAGYYAKVYGDKKEGKVNMHILKDIKRLLLPFAVTMILLSAWGILQACFKHDWAIALRFPLSLLWASSDAINSEKFGVIHAGPMWFLIALFWIREVFFYGAGWLLMHLKSKGDEIILGCSLLISFAAAEIHPFVKPFPWCIWQCLAALNFYSIGWYAHRHRIHSAMKIFCIVCWPMSIMWGRIELDWGMYGCYPVDVLGACGAVMIIDQICVWIYKRTGMIYSNYHLKQQSLLQWIGMNTLAILCVHSFDVMSKIGHSIYCRVPSGIGEYSLSYASIRMIITIGIVWGMMKVPKIRRIYA